MLRYLEHNPAQYVKRLKEEEQHIQVISDEAIRKLLEVSSPKFRQIITIFILTGMRLGEFLHLRWSDVDFRHKQLIIQNREDWKTKSRKPRVIPMHPTVEKILKNLPRDGEYVFSTNSGKTLGSYIRTVCRKGRYPRQFQDVPLNLCVKPRDERS